MRGFTLWRRFVGSAQVKIVGDEASLARLFHPLLDDGMPRRHSLQHGLLDQLGAHITPRCCQVRETCQQVRLGHGRGAAADAAGAFENELSQLGKDALLDFDAAVVRGEDFAFVVFQFRRGEAFRIHQRLLALVVGGRERQVRLGDLDVIAEDRVIAHLQRSDASALPFTVLDGRDGLTARGGNRAQLIEFRIDVRRDSAAIDKR